MLKSFKMVGGGLSMLGQNNNGAYDDDISSYNSNAHSNNDEAVDNLLNEASEFNCHEI